MLGSFAMQSPYARRAAPALVLLLALAASGAQSPLGRSLRAARSVGTLYVELTTLARAIGAVATSDGAALTFRGAEGVVTFFAGSSDALQQRPGDPGPVEVSLSAPVLEVDSDWWAPLSALDLLGVAPAPNATPSGTTDAVTAGGEEFQLALEPFPGAQAPARVAAEGDDGAPWETDVLPGDVPVLRFFDGDVSLSLLDLALLPIARPDLTRAVDAVLDEAAQAAGAGDNLLLLQVVALTEAAWEPALRFSQGDRELEVRYPYRLLVVSGGADSVGPEGPVAGVVLLPAGFDLYAPLQVEWRGTHAVVTFRR